MKPDQDALDQIADVFPLPLAPIEHFLLLDDRPQCPLTPVVELHFSGPLQIDGLQKALSHCLIEHPLLSSRIRWQDGRPLWQFDAHFAASVLQGDDCTIKEQNPSTRLPGVRPFDLEAECGLRVFYQEFQNERTSRLTVQFHHAACDGIGIRRFLIDVLERYANATSSATPEGRRRCRSPNLRTLLDRDDYSNLEQEPARVQLNWWDRICNAYYFYFKTPHPLVGSGQPSRPSDSAEPMVHHRFSESESAAILERSRRDGVRINDLAIASLFRICRDWNETRGMTGAKKRIRILMPVDLRRRRDAALPAANRLSFSFLGRTHGQCDDWATLLSSVQAETRAIKDSRVYMDFLKGMETLARYPMKFRRAIDRNRNMSSAVLTYSGDLLRGLTSRFPNHNQMRTIGDASLTGVLAAPPARENTNIAIGLCLNWGRIAVSAQWNRETFSREDAEDFVGMFAERLSERAT